MVSDPDETPIEVLTQEANGRAFYGRQLVVTLVGLTLYWLGGSISLPFLDRQALADFLSLASGVRASILTLGATPLITGFLLVELFSLLIPAGRRLRRGGIAGRTTLNRAALVVSLGCAVVQACGIALFLETITPPAGQPIVPSPGWGFRLVVAATLTAVTAALFMLGNFLSARGIGNGFCLFLVMDQARSTFPTWQAGPPSPGPIPLASLLFPIVLSVLLIAYFVRTDRERSPSLLPTFPQGIAPVPWALIVLGLPQFFRSLSWWPTTPDLPALWLTLPALLVLIPLLSWATFHLFSGPSQLRSELAGAPDGLAELSHALKRRLLPSTAILTAGTIALVAWPAFGPSAPVSDFGWLTLLVAIGFDLWDQGRFVLRHGPVERLLELDNVHLAHQIADRLESRGIDVHLQARHYRGLLYFFRSLMKIGVFVPQSQVARAWQEIEEIPVEVI